MMALPLFLGMSGNDIDELMSNHKIAHHVYSEKRTVVAADEPCNGLIIVASGKLSVITESDDHSYTVEETFPSPGVVQPERVFGLSPRYSRTFVTKEKSTIVYIPKKDVVSLSDHYQIFRINLLNTISSQVQRLARMPWRHTPDTLRGRIVRFVYTRCMLPAGEKTVIIKMAHLAKELNAPRLNISKELHAMESEGLIELMRNKIIVKQLEKAIEPHS